MDIIIIYFRRFSFAKIFYGESFLTFYKWVFDVEGKSGIIK